MTRRKAIGWLFLLAAACGGQSEFAKAMHAADSRLESRDFSGTLAEWQRAAASATDDEDRVEALYRAARLKERVGRLDEAASDLEELLRKFPTSNRAPRILMDLGRLEERREQPERAVPHYRLVVEKYPSSGNAKSALAQLLELARENRLAENVAFQGKLKDPELLSFLRFDHATLVAADDAQRGAEEFEALARQEPLPEGRYSDESLLMAARLRIRLGELAQAKQDLESLLPPIENAWLVGSYNRKAYADGVFLLAVLAAKGLKDGTMARHYLELHVRSFPESISRDDVEYELALLDRSEKGSEVACSRLEDTLKRDPSSRFRRCREFLCSGAEGAPYCGGAMLDLPQAGDAAGTSH